MNTSPSPKDNCGFQKVALSKVILSSKGFIYRVPLSGMIRAYRGFTYMELLWVIAILATVCSVATPHFIGPLNQLAMEKKAREIYMAIAYTKQMAVNQNGTFGVFFDVTAGQQKVICYQNMGYDGGAPVIKPANTLLNRITKKPYVIWVDEEDEYGNAVMKANFGGRIWVEFDPLGVPNVTGLILLAGNDFSHTITVSQIGRLHLE
ncbi:MAG: hypothetical protein JXA79_10945 [Deltaproteobacteria bacterium]|nr:hypothetical protein [Deltaproteobacteria bacterium]